MYFTDVTAYNNAGSLYEKHDIPYTFNGIFCQYRLRRAFKFNQTHK